MHLLRHHPKRIELVLSAMRHFARELTERGVRLRYTRLDDPANRQFVGAEVRRAADELCPERIIAPSRVSGASLRGCAGGPGIGAIRLRSASIAGSSALYRAFAAWPKAGRSLRLEFFYREMRRRTGLLMDGANPVGRR
jgi:deoxyribodipyrimidine photolyase-related protein